MRSNVEIYRALPSRSNSSSKFLLNSLPTSLRDAEGSLPDDDLWRHPDVVLQDAGLPGERREHIRELTDQVLQLPLLGSREMGVDVNNHGIRGGEGCELVSSPNQLLQTVDVVELLGSSPPWLTHTVSNGPIFSSTM